LSERRARVANRLVEAGDTFDIVREDGQRAVGKQVLQGLPVAVEVAAQQFNANRWHSFLNSLNTLSVMLGAAVRLVVAIHDGDYDILQAHSFDGVGQPFGLLSI